MVNIFNVMSHGPTNQSPITRLPIPPPDYFITTISMNFERLTISQSYSVNIRKRFELHKPFQNFFLYRWKDSNLHAIKHRFLRPECLPFHHIGICDSGGARTHEPPD